MKSSAISLAETLPKWGEPLLWIVVMLQMGEDIRDSENWILGNLGSIFRKCVFSVVKVGPIPGHVAFILDGNRRYARRNNLAEGMGHRLGFEAFKSMLIYCYELGIKYVTVYAFSIDNFKRRPDEVQQLMELLQEKLDSLLEKESIVNQYGVRIHFAGDLTLLSESVRLSAQRVMSATSKNPNALLSICIAYTSTNEILRAVQQSCEDKWDEFMTSESHEAGYGLNKNGMVNGLVDKEPRFISVADIEKHMDLAIVPDPDVIIRTSGETRLSNFLLWQSARCLLYSPSVLWPEINMWHLVWAVLKFQRMNSYIEKKKKQL